MNTKDSTPTFLLETANTVRSCVLLHKVFSRMLNTLRTGEANLRF